MSRSYKKCKKRELPEASPWSRKASQGESLSGQTPPPESPGRHPHRQHPLPAASAHTPCQCVRAYAWSPPWEPATSLRPPPLILPMWLRASKAPRREGGGVAGARPPLLTAHLQPVHQGHFPCSDWPLGVEKLGGPRSQLPMTRCRHQGSAWCPITRSGPRDCQSRPEPGKNGLAPPARGGLVPLEQA